MPDERLKENLSGRLAGVSLEREKLAKLVEPVKLPPPLARGLVRPGARPEIQAPVTVAAAPETNPLTALPFPNPGDRIRADDFRSLSQSLVLIRNTFALSGSLLGRPFSQARSVLEAGNYHIVMVMSVFGTIIENLEDPSLDNRKVIQVLPVSLGTPQVVVVLTEAVETRRFAPNLIGLTHKEASERLRNILGDVTFPSVSKTAGQLVGLSLAEAQKVMV